MAVSVLIVIGEVYGSYGTPNGQPPDADGLLVTVTAGLLIIGIGVAGVVSTFLGVVVGLAGLHKDNPAPATLAGIRLSVAAPAVPWATTSALMAPNLMAGVVIVAWFLTKYSVCYWVIHRLYFNGRNFALLHKHAMALGVSHGMCLLIGWIASKVFHNHSLFTFCLTAVVVHWLAICIVCTRKAISTTPWEELILRWGLLIGILIAIIDQSLWHFVGL